jgi:SAM-dependent methyltransferase
MKEEMNFNDPLFRKIFFDIHSDLPREGPGSLDSAQKAFSLIKDIPDRPEILDVGCGPGLQTMYLAQMTDGHITAVDNHQPFIDRVIQLSVDHGFDHRINAVNADMNDLDFPENHFDLIWSEGALYSMGFFNALTSLRYLLRPGGWLAASEAVWLKEEEPPSEVWDIWKDEYPSISTIDANIQMIRDAGYTLKGHFTLPERDWLKEYYAPLEKRLELLQQKYSEDPFALEVIEYSQKEIDDYRKYSDWYGYEFFVCRRE